MKNTVLENTVASKPTKERILDAAEHLFAQHGFEATSIVDIATQVGIRGPAVYKHFSGKTAVYDAVLDRLFTPFTTMINQNKKTSVRFSEHTRLQKLVEHHIAHPNISKIIQQATMAGGEQLEHLTKQWYIPFFSNITKKAPGGLATIMAFHSMILGYITLAPLHKKIFDVDPLSNANISDQLALQKHLAQTLEEHNWSW